MFSYSPDRYMVAVLRLVKEAQWTERDKAEGNKSKPRVGRCVCAWWDIYLLLNPCFFTQGLKFGLITTCDVEGEFSSALEQHLRSWQSPRTSETFLCPKSALLFLTDREQEIMIKNPCSAVFLGSLSMVNRWVGLDGSWNSVLVSRPPGPPCCIPAAPWAPLELAGRCGWTRSDPSSAGNEATCSLHWPPSLPTNTKFIAGLRGKKKKKWALQLLFKIERNNRAQYSEFQVFYLSTDSTTVLILYWPKLS